jgi:hypothetical protein
MVWPTLTLPPLKQISNLTRSRSKRTSRELDRTAQPVADTLHGPDDAFTECTDRVSQSVHDSLDASAKRASEGGDGVLRVRCNAFCFVLRDFACDGGSGGRRNVS